MPTKSPAMTAMTIDMYFKSLISEWMNYLFFPFSSLYAKINIFLRLISKLTRYCARYCGCLFFLFRFVFGCGITYFCKTLKNSAIYDRNNCSSVAFGSVLHLG